MKIREVTNEQINNYLRITPTAENSAFLEICKDAAIQYISKYTGLPVESSSGDTINSHDDLTIAYLILVEDMWDNRSTTADQANPNRTIETILGLHRKNLL